MTPIWTPERDAILTEIWTSMVPTLDIPAEFNARVTISPPFTMAALTNRARKLHLLRPAAIRRAAGLKGGETQSIWRHPDSLPEFRRLWTETQNTAAEIARELNERFGMSLTSERLYNHATKRGFIRGNGQHIITTTRVVIDAALVRRIDVTRPPDNPTRPVPPGSFPARGFSMLGGRVL